MIKKALNLLIVAVAGSLILVSVVFAQSFTATQLPVASNTQPAEKEEAQPTANKENTASTESEDGASLILSSPLPSFRTFS